MFTSLENPNSTIKELLDDYKLAFETEARLNADLEKAHGKLMQAQSRCLGQPASKALKAARTKYDDLRFKIDSCDYVRSRVRNRLVEVMPAETEERRVQLLAEFKDLEKDQADLRNEFLTAAARAAVIGEQLNGLTVYAKHSGDLAETTPPLDVRRENVFWDGGYEFFAQQVERFRDELAIRSNNSIAVRMNGFRDELATLEEDAEKDVEQRVTQLLAACLPMELVEEAAKESAARRTSAITYNYDHWNERRHENVIQ